MKNYALIEELSPYQITYQRLRLHNGDWILTNQNKESKD